MGEPKSVVLGVSCDYHDSAAALLVDGEVVAAAEEERFTRKKHDSSAPRRSIDACLRTAGVDASAVEVVAFYERPVEVLSRFLASRRRQGPAGFGSFVRDTPRLVGAHLMVAYRIERILRDLGSYGAVEFYYSDHHRSHAASAFFPSPFDTAAVLTVDGIGEWATATISRGAGRHLDVLEEQRYPDSLGLVYSFITAYCGFVPNSDEYKLMGLAPYGEPRFRESLAELVEINADGSVKVDAAKLGWFRPRGLRRRQLHVLLDGPPTGRGEPPSQRDADLAASVQQLTEESLLRLARHALELSGESRLCLAGGVALNCVANGRLLDEHISEDLWIQPAAGDAGAALGAALSTWHEVLCNERATAPTDSMQGAFLGPQAGSDEVRSWLQDSGLAYDEVLDRTQLCDRVAGRLDRGDVVGWFQGRMEFGPRALGHRSILADARRPDARSLINDRVKGRESFRPFAPAVLLERVGEWFDLVDVSPYMLLVAQVRDARVEGAASDVGSDGLLLPFAERADLVGSPIPACTHVDGSARVQTVDAHTNPEFHMLLSAFERLTDCPVLLNTSFNVAGEPIVASPDDALRTARTAGLDLLVIEDFVIDSSAWRNP